MLGTLTGMSGCTCGCRAQVTAKASRAFIAGGFGCRVVGGEDWYFSCRSGVGLGRELYVSDDKLNFVLLSKLIYTLYLVP